MEVASSSVVSGKVAVSNQRQRTNSRIYLTGKIEARSNPVAGIVVDDYVQNRDGRSGSSAVVLTQREREVLRLLAEGKPSKEIALLLDISTKTIDACRRRIMQKLNIQSLAELIKYAIREGLTTIDP